MTISMHQALVPPALQMLSALSAVLDKAAASAAARKIEPAVLLQSRLAPDMFPLVRQVQVATDAVKGGAARLAGVAVPSWPDTEASFEDLQARLKKTTDYLRSFKPEQIDGSEERAISFTAGNTERKFKGQGYLMGWVFPNFFFHVTAAYAILRHNGVELGKRDFLGAVPSV